MYPRLADWPPPNQEGTAVRESARLSVDNGQMSATNTPSPAPADAWVSMRHMQRAMVFMKAQGMACDELLQQGGLTHEQLADGDRMVPLSAVEAILSAAQRRHDDPLLGLRMADDIQPATLGALGFVLQACSTVGDLVDVLAFDGLV